MKLATIRTTAGTEAVRVDGDTATEVGARDVGALLADPRWRERAEAADGPLRRVGTLNYAPVVPRPGKIVCVGLNYRTHIQEMGRELPAYPTLFAKFPEALIGPYDDLVLPASPTPSTGRPSWRWCWASGTPCRRGQRASAIAGYAVLNDVSMRDWQFRTGEWLQGKTFEATAPFGPHLVTTTRWRPTRGSSANSTAR